MSCVGMSPSLNSSDIKRHIPMDEALLYMARPVRYLKMPLPLAFLPFGLGASHLGVSCFAANRTRTSPRLSSPDTKKPHPMDEALLYLARPVRFERTTA
jgi:hypothetical protein